MSYQEEIEELRRRFSDLTNYEAYGEPIDPIFYRDATGDTLLHIAVIRNDIKSVEMLVGLGVDVNARGDMSKTPLHYAAGYGYEEIYQYLKENGANPQLIDEFGRTPAQKLKETQNKNC